MRRGFLGRSGPSDVSGTVSPLYFFPRTQIYGRLRFCVGKLKASRARSLLLQIHQRSVCDHKERTKSAQRACRINVLPLKKGHSKVCGRALFPATKMPCCSLPSSLSQFSVLVLCSSAGRIPADVCTLCSPAASCSCHQSREPHASTLPINHPPPPTFHPAGALASSNLPREGQGSQ